MKTLVAAIQKGGQGKTFVTCHLAYYFYEKGLRVAVLDLDVQGNTSFTLSCFSSSIPASAFFEENTSHIPEQIEREAQEKNTQATLTLFKADAALAERETKPLGESSAALEKNLKHIAPLYDICFIDTKPSLGVTMVSSLLVCDYILSPIELEAYSLHGMQKMVSVLAHVREKNQHMHFLGMLPNKVDTRKPRHRENLTLLRNNFPALVFPFVIGARDSIAEALGEKKPVWKIKKTAARKAAIEVRTFCAHIFNILVEKN